jgi:hypothetical protein
MTIRFKFHATLLALGTSLALTIENTSFATEQSSFTTSTPTAMNSVAENAATATPAVTVQAQSTAGAVEMVNRVIASLALGPAFDAKVRQRVWTSDREMVGVGTYEQAGHGSGQFNLQLTMHDGDGKHTLQQISDGRLAWTRSEIASQVKLKRVDVGRLGEWTSHLENKSSVSPRLRIGAWTEMLDMISRDYVLRIAAGTLESQTVWILSGTLRDELRDELRKTSNRSEWPPLYPAHVRVAIAAKPLDNSGFGEGLPVRMEFFAAPTKRAKPHSETSPRDVGPMITLVELYSIRPIDPPPVARFRFENQDADVNFINETDRYLELYGIQLSDSDRKRMRR